MAIFGIINLQVLVSLILSAVSIYKGMKPRQAPQPAGEIGMANCSSSAWELL